MAEPKIVAVVTDLMFRSRLQEQARRLGYDVFVADDAASAIEAMSSDASLAVIDLHARGIDWRECVSLAKDGGMSVLAFGRHTEAQLLRAAREAGCDRVVPRSQLVEEMPGLIGELAAGGAPAG